MQLPLRLVLLLFEDAKILHYCSTIKWIIERESKGTGAEMDMNIELPVEFMSCYSVEKKMYLLP